MTLHKRRNERCSGQNKIKEKASESDLLVMCILPWVPEAILAQIGTFVSNKLRSVRPKAFRSLFDTNVPI